MSNEMVTVNEAAALLGTTKEKIARLVRQGVLTSRPSVVDARRRLIPRVEIDRIVQAEGRRPLPDTGRSARLRPRTAGMYTGPLAVEADEVEEYLERHWRRP